MEYFIALPWFEALLIYGLHMGFQIFTVSIFLHREQSHRALKLNPFIRNTFRFLCWYTTGMVVKEWVAVHRKHHAYVDTADDPHSPLIKGLWNVIWFGVEMYQSEARNPETIRKFGKGTPDDWIERNVYAHPLFRSGGIALLFLVYAVFFTTIVCSENGYGVYTIFQGIAFGVAIAALQTLVIPVLAASFINGIGHWRQLFCSYRNFDTEDTSTNVTFFGFFIGGEELHNNHHMYPKSAKFSYEWFEFDPSWVFFIYWWYKLGLCTDVYIGTNKTS